MTGHVVMRGRWKDKDGCGAIQAMWKVARWYCQQGLMVGTIFREVLLDLHREGLSQDAQEIDGTALIKLLCSVSPEWPVQFNLSGSGSEAACRLTGEHCTRKRSISASG